MVRNAHLSTRSAAFAPVQVRLGKLNFFKYCTRAIFGPGQPIDRTSEHKYECHGSCGSSQLLKLNLSFELINFAGTRTTRTTPSTGRMVRPSTHHTDEGLQMFVHLNIEYWRANAHY